MQEEFKTKTGKEYAAPSGHAVKKEGKKEEKKEEKKKDSKKEEGGKSVAASAPDDDSKKSLLGLTMKKEDDLAEWYSQIITKAELIEYYDVCRALFFYCPPFVRHDRHRLLHSPPSLSLYIYIYIFHLCSLSVCSSHPAFPFPSH